MSKQQRSCVKCRDEVSPTSPVRQCSSFFFFFCLCNFTSCELSWVLTRSVCVFVCLCPFCGYYIIAFFCIQTVCRLSLCAETWTTSAFLYLPHDGGVLEWVDCKETSNICPCVSTFFNICTFVAMHPPVNKPIYISVYRRTMYINAPMHPIIYG